MAPQEPNTSRLSKELGELGHIVSFFIRQTKLQANQGGYRYYARKMKLYNKNMRTMLKQRVWRGGFVCVVLGGYIYLQDNYTYL